MCGISACVVKNGNAINIALAMLEKLEYRGYDSAGVAGLDKLNEFVSIKSIGKLEKLLTEQKKQKLDSKIAISHTRWATHGKTVAENTHPIFSQNANWAVVHNGIIENAKTIKKNLTSEGYDFRGQTDTECIANLLEKNENTHIVKNLALMLKACEGSLAVAVLHKNDKNLYVCKRFSPLYIGKVKNSYYAVSDITAFDNDVQEYVALEDNEIACANERECKVYDINLK